jgi:hypothetical protein
MKKIPLSKWRIGRKQGWHVDRNGLILLDGETDRILSLLIEEDGKITFQEECDGYFFVTMEKEEAKKALLEALAWIDEERP